MSMQSLHRSGRMSLILLAVSMSGCATISTVNQVPADAAAKVDAAAKADQGATCKLIFRSKSGKAKVATVPLDGMVTVGQLLEDQRAMRSWGTPTVTIYRKSDDPLKPIRLEIDLDGSGKKVKEEFNYALFPDDQVVIGRSDGSNVNSLLNRLTSSLGL